MIYSERLLLIFFSIINFLIYAYALKQIKNNNVYGLTKYLFFIGAFVWGDVFILSPFWIIVSIISIYLNSWYLFLLFVSIFWVIRSFGEIIYWLNEQFSGKNRNPPHTLNFHKFIKNDAIWFIYQLFWQCIFVFSVVLSIYFSIRWLEGI